MTTISAAKLARSRVIWEGLVDWNGGAPVRLCGTRPERHSERIRANRPERQQTRFATPNNRSIRAEKMGAPDGDSERPVAVRVYRSGLCGT